MAYTTLKPVNLNNKTIIEQLYPAEKELIEELYNITKGSPLEAVLERILISQVAELKGCLHTILDSLKKELPPYKGSGTENEYLSAVRNYIIKDSQGMFENMYTEKHEPRKKDPHFQLFRESKDLLQKQLDIPCYICKITNKEIEEYKEKTGMPLKVPLGNEAIQMELHHYYLEYNYVKTISLEYFNQYLLPIINKDNILRNYFKAHPEKYEQVKHNPLIKQLGPKNFTLQPLKSQDELDRFITGHPMNMMSLCTVHHRSYNSGIHEITMPYWLVQKCIKPEDLIKQRFYGFILKNLKIRHIR